MQSNSISSSSFLLNTIDQPPMSFGLAFGKACFGKAVTTLTKVRVVTVLRSRVDTHANKVVVLSGE